MLGVVLMTPRPDDLLGYDRTAANLEFIKLSLKDIWVAIDRLERHWRCKVRPGRARKAMK